jgi:type I restriction enzyme M protein
MDIGGHPKELIGTIAEELLESFKGIPLLDTYDVYQHLMDYWAESMQDDCYVISDVGWKAGAAPREIVQVKDKNNKLVWPETEDFLQGRRRYKSDLIPVSLLIARYLSAENDAIAALEADIANIDQQLTEAIEEHGGEDGLLTEVIEGEGDKQKITVKNLKARLKDIGRDRMTKLASYLKEYKYNPRQVDQINDSIKWVKSSDVSNGTSRIGHVDPICIFKKQS